MTTLRAPAKLTWSLAVTGVRDDGFHLLDAEMVSLDLADELELTESDTTTVDWRGEYPPPPGEDLIAQALAKCGRTATVHVHKRIPPGGGLGGGSADAAAVLRWAGVRDPAIAVTLGADVPFCLLGGRARVRGVGELVEPLAFEDRRVTLVLAPFGVATPAVYRRFDERVARGLAVEGRNHLFSAARDVEPRLGSLVDWLAARSGATVELAGSGATTFLEGWFDELEGELASPVGVVRAVRCRTEPAT